MNISESLKSCFISAPADENIESVVALMNEFSIAIVEPNYRSGEKISLQIHDAIRKADFVFAYIPHISAVMNAAYEIGYAEALRKPIFLVANRKIQLPDAMDRLHRVDADISELEPISFHLEHFLI